MVIQQFCSIAAETYLLLCSYPRPPYRLRQRLPSLHVRYVVFGLAHRVGASGVQRADEMGGPTSIVRHADMKTVQLTKGFSWFWHAVDAKVRCVIPRRRIDFKVNMMNLN